MTPGFSTCPAWRQSKAILRRQEPGAIRRCRLPAFEIAAGPRLRDRALDHIPAEASPADNALHVRRADAPDRAIVRDSGAISDDDEACRIKARVPRNLIWKLLE